MSTPDKAANRSSEKHKNHALFVHAPPREKKPDSWWTVGAAPDAREKFVAAHRDRCDEGAWSTVSAHNTAGFR